MDPQEKNLFLFICDISGYTTFMVQNQMDYTHGILIIQKILDDLVKEIELPMKISKLEGDAIFFYLIEDEMPELFKKDRFLLGQKILNIFTIFYAKVEALKNATDCQCGACSNLDKLNLKIIGHFGTAIMVKIGSFNELNGVSVIVAHRLLKNTIPHHCYFLITESAYQQMRLPPSIKNETLTEEVKDIGFVPIHVYFPVIQKSDLPYAAPSALTFKKTHFQLFWGALLLKLHLKKTPFFHNLSRPQQQ